MAGAACTTPTTPTPEPKAIATSFASRLLLGGSAWKSFTQTTTSLVTARLAALSPDAEVVVRIGFGTLEGTTCTTTMTVDTAADSETPQLSMLLAPGRYCVQIFDIGNIKSINDFVIFLVQQP
jgi:hypothetical protein